MMPGGQFFGFLWFFMLFLAAITSSISMLQPVIAFLEEGFGLRRHASVAFLGLIAALGTGFVLYFSEGLVALDTFDFWVGTFLIYVLAMFQAVLYGWVLGIKQGEQAAHSGAHIRIPHFFQFMLKYVTPTYLLAIFVGFCWQSLPSKFEPLGELEGVPASVLQVNDIPKEVRAVLSENDINLSGEATAVSADGELVIYEDASQEKRLAVVRATQGSIVVGITKPGYIANVLASDASMYSIYFLVTLAVFLLLLVHIAGRRWEAAGLFFKSSTSS